MREGNVAPRDVRVATTRAIDEAFGRERPVPLPLFPQFCARTTTLLNDMLESDATAQRLEAVSESLSIIGTDVENTAAVDALQGALLKLGERTASWEARLTPASNVTRLRRP